MFGNRMDAFTRYCRVNRRVKHVAWTNGPNEWTTQSPPYRDDAGHDGAVGSHPPSIQGRVSSYLHNTLLFIKRPLQVVRFVVVLVSRTALKKRKEKREHRDEISPPRQHLCANDMRVCVCVCVFGRHHPPPRPHLHLKGPTQVPPWPH